MSWRPDGLSNPFQDMLDKAREVGSSKRTIHELEYHSIAWRGGETAALEALKKAGHQGLWDNKGFSFSADGDAALMGTKYDGQRGTLVFIPEEKA